MEYLRKFEEQKTIDFNKIEYHVNLERLRRYVKVLKITGVLDNLLLKYAIIIHNFIIIESKFKKLFIEKRVCINENLSEEFTNFGFVPDYSVFWINKFLVRCYDPDSKLRNNIENVGRIDEINKILSKNQDIYSRLYTYEDIDMIINTNKFNI